MGVGIVRGDPVACPWIPGRTGNEAPIGILAAVTVEIVQLGEPVLRAVARDLTAGEIRSRELRKTIDAMAKAMEAARGVGLAAPQVGLGIRLAVLADRAEVVAQDPAADERERVELPFTVMINPTYEPLAGDETRDHFEGCLSMAGYRALVRRYRRVRAHWTDPDGGEHHEEFSGWPARIVQHEIDHLDGVIFVDRCFTRSLMTTEALARWQETPIEELKRRFSVV
jgi:peptide deformylase